MIAVFFGLDDTDFIFIIGKDTADAVTERIFGSFGGRFLEAEVIIGDRTEKLVFEVDFAMFVFCLNKIGEICHKVNYNIRRNEGIELEYHPWGGGILKCEIFNCLDGVDGVCHN